MEVACVIDSLQTQRPRTGFSSHKVEIDPGLTVVLGTKDAVRKCASQTLVRIPLSGSDTKSHRWDRT